MSTTSGNVVSPVLHHVNLKTTQLQAMIDWYTAVVGSKVTFQFPAGAWLTNDAANHRIALLALPGYADDPNKDRHTGLHHTAFEYQSFGELMNSYDRLRDQGIRPEMCLDHGMTVSIYYRDPDRNMVELQADVFGSWEKSKGWMQTSPDFAANPIGVFFDPDKLLAAHRGGANLENLHRRMMASEFLPNPVPILSVPDPV
jgi:catechol-2,3-dioxygenase